MPMQIFRGVETVYYGIVQISAVSVRFLFLVFPASKFCDTPKDHPPHRGIQNEP